MSTKSEPLDGVIAGSGLPFQTAVANLIRSGLDRVRCSLRMEEHPWEHKSGKSGFIDIVAQHNDWLIDLVIECKRGKDNPWVFLLPSSSVNAESQESALEGWKTTATLALGVAARVRIVENYGLQWHKVQIGPPSYEASHCIVRGQGDTDRPMLERTAGELILACESYGREVRRLESASADQNLLRVILPVIVTCAPLHLCVFNWQSVSMVDGSVAARKYIEVPYLRFTKAFTTHWKWRQEFSDVAQLHKHHQRTVLVVNARYLSQALADIYSSDKSASTRTVMLRDGVSLNDADEGRSF